MKNQTVSAFAEPVKQLPDLIGLPVEVPVWQTPNGHWFAGKSRENSVSDAGPKNAADHAAGLWSVGNTREEAIANYHARKKRHVWPPLPPHLPKLPDGAVYLGKGKDFPTQSQKCLMSTRGNDWYSNFCGDTDEYHYAAPAQEIADRIAAQMEATK